MISRWLECPLKVLCLPVRMIYVLQERHDWSTCPNAHRGERAARRCPRTYSYTPEPCPEYNKVRLAMGSKQFRVPAVMLLLMLLRVFKLHN